MAGTACGNWWLYPSVERRMTDYEGMVIELSNYGSVYFYRTSHVSILTCDIDIANLSVHLSVRYILVLYENGLEHIVIVFSSCGSPIILVLPASNTTANLDFKVTIILNVR